MESNNKVTIWTRQDIKSLDDINATGVHRIKKIYIKKQLDDISEYYIRLYDWFVENASKIVPRPDGVEYPIWCSISEKNMLKPIEGTVVYELEIHRDEVIYFSGRKWDYVLNHRYIGKDEEDEKAYLKELEGKGFKNGVSFIEGKYANFYSLEKKKVMDSWMRVFEIDDWNIFEVQANIWEIRKDMIKNILFYDE